MELTTFVRIILLWINFDRKCKEALERLTGEVCLAINAIWEILVLLLSFVRNRKQSKTYPAAPRTSEKKFLPPMSSNRIFKVFQDSSVGLIRKNKQIAELKGQTFSVLLVWQTDVFSSSAWVPKDTTITHNFWTHDFTTTLCKADNLHTQFSDKRDFGEDRKMRQLRSTEHKSAGNKVQ